MFVKGRRFDSRRRMVARRPTFLCRMNSKKITKNFKISKFNFVFFWYISPQVYGRMPSFATLFDLKADPVAEFGQGTMPLKHERKKTKILNWFRFFSSNITQERETLSPMRPMVVLWCWAALAICLALLYSYCCFCDTNLINLKKKFSCWSLQELYDPRKLKVVGDATAHCSAVQLWSPNRFVARKKIEF